ncbi:MAG TPA: ATP-binding protein [Thermomicrobiales bacterium]|nr:ATP-binding protein [Thermomicrobiales bacterium]
MSTTSSDLPPIPDPVPGSGVGVDVPRGVVEIEGGVPWLPRTLTGQVILPVFLVALFLIGALTWVLGGVIERGYRERFDAVVQDETRMVAAAVSASTPLDSTPGDPAASRLIAGLAAATNAWLTIALPDGTVIADSLADPTTVASIRLNAAFVEALRDGSAIGEGPAYGGGEAWRYAVMTIPGPDGAEDGLVVRVGHPVAPLESEIAQVRWLGIGGALIVIAAIALAAWALVRRVGHGVRQIGDHMASIVPQAPAADLRSTSFAEIAAVRTALNQLTLDVRDVLSAARHARAQLESTLSTLSDGVILTDREGLVLRANAAAGRLLDVDTDSVVGLPFVFATRDHELGELQRLSMRTGQIARKDGIEIGFERRQIDAVAQPVVDDEDQLTLVVLRDVTELRRLEQVRREFVANVSHELRTPLASIRAMVETLEAGAIDEPGIAGDFLARIVTEVERLALLVDELLDLARLESGRVNLRLEPLAPADLIGTGARRLSSQVDRARLTMVIDVPDDLPPVLADRNRIEQVLLNLVHNAIKFTPPGGEIRITARQEGRFLLVEVTDTGVGIAEDELPRLFERFYKADRARRSEGTGLGLAIAKHIVAGHGGTIAVRSTLGKGSTFAFSLALARTRRDSHDPADALTTFEVEAPDAASVARAGGR